MAQMETHTQRNAGVVEQAADAAAHGRPGALLVRRVVWFKVPAAPARAPVAAAGPSSRSFDAGLLSTPAPWPQAQASSAALPPAAAVLIVSVCSAQKRYR